MGIEKLVSLAVPVVFVLLSIAEKVAPARPLPRVPGWRWQGLVFFALSGVLATGLPALYGDALRAHAVLDLSGLGVATGAIVGLVTVELALYGWHRLRHATFLWRIHQLHHSAERLDVFGAMFGHPLDLASTLFVSALVTTGVLGLSTGAATAVGLVAAFCALFQHANLRTPRWLGYIIQRPEAHSVHHARGVHAGNYCDLPMWDIVFGTFKNPARFELEAGFVDGASRRLGALLAGRDVTTRREA